MFTSVKTAVSASAIVAIVALAHVAVMGSAAVAMQASADQAIVPVMVAEPIVVRGNTIQIVKAERIEIRATRSAMAASSAKAAS